MNRYPALVPIELIFPQVVALSIKLIGGKIYEDSQKRYAHLGFHLWVPQGWGDKYTWK